MTNSNEELGLKHVHTCNINIASELDIQLDSGSPISFIKESLVSKSIVKCVENNSQK